MVGKVQLYIGKRASNLLWLASLRQGIGLSIGVTFCELLFSLLAAGGIDLSELVVDPMSKYFGQSLDSLWARGGRQGLRIIPEGYATLFKVANEIGKLSVQKLGVEEFVEMLGCSNFVLYVNMTFIRNCPL